MQTPLPNAYHELQRRQPDPQQDHKRPGECHEHQWLPVSIWVMLHPARCSHEAQCVERYERQVEADEPAPEDRLPESLVQLESECLGKPAGVSGHGTEYHAPNCDVMEVRNQEETVMQNEVRRRDRHEYPRHAADDESHDKADRPI